MRIPNPKKKYSIDDIHRLESLLSTIKEETESEGFVGDTITNDAIKIRKEPLQERTYIGQQLKFGFIDGGTF